MKQNTVEKNAYRAKVNIYLSVDIDREIFKDEKGNEYTLPEAMKLLNDAAHIDTLSVNMTLMCQRLIQQFNGNFAEARKFYNS